MASKETRRIKFYCSPFLHPKRHITLNVISDEKRAGSSVIVSSLRRESVFRSFIHSLSHSLIHSFIKSIY